MRATQENPSLVDVLETVAAAARELANVARCYGRQGPTQATTAILHGARVLEGVASAVMNPQMFQNLKQAATILSIRRGERPFLTGHGCVVIGSGRSVKDHERLPTSSMEITPATAHLKLAVASARKRDPNMTPGELAERVVRAREIAPYLGTQRVLPHRGTRQELVTLLTTAIEDLFSRKGRRGDEDLESEDVITACARACGNKREIFGALRKRTKR